MRATTAADSTYRIGRSGRLLSAVLSPITFCCVRQGHSHRQADTRSPPARNINNITLRPLPSSITTLFDADGVDSLMVTFGGDSGYDCADASALSLIKRPIQAHCKGPNVSSQDDAKGRLQTSQASGVRSVSDECAGFAFAWVLQNEWTS